MTEQEGGRLGVLMRAATSDVELPEQLTERVRDNARRRTRRHRRLSTGATALVVAGAALTTALARDHGSPESSLPAGPASVSPAAPAFHLTLPPGTSASRARELVHECTNWWGSAQDRPTEATSSLRAIASDNLGTTVAIMGRPQQALPANVMMAQEVLQLCYLLPDGTVDTTLDQHLQLPADALRGDVQTETSGGGVTDRVRSKDGADTPWLWSIAGRVSRRVARVMVTTPDDQVVQAVVDNGFFVARKEAVDSNSLKRFQPDKGFIIHAYDDAGHPLKIADGDTTEAATVSWP